MANQVILDWNRYLELARQTVAEGCVLLENRDKALPLKKGECISVFGRIQNHYYKSGTGSGGMVITSKVMGIVDGLQESGAVRLNEELLQVYKEWDKENPFVEGEGWGNEPWSQEEMPLSDAVAEKAAKSSDAAVVIIGRTAGEDKDSSNTKGSYRLTDIEEEMLAVVRKHFTKMIVLLNTGGLIDMSFVERYTPEAVMYVWQGGMVGGLGVADVLTGAVSPSGHLTDTVAYNISDYPSDAYFGDEERNYYCEDIYVGYRYFETFAKEKVRYPFGYGCSYTTFQISVDSFDNEAEAQTISICVRVKNSGDTAGKEVVQIYAEAPQGMLGKPKRVLVAFQKTKKLLPGEEEELKFKIPYSSFSSYDDTGKSGASHASVLEAGTYRFYVGENVREADLSGSFAQDSLLILEELPSALAPVESFERMRPEKGQDGEYKIVMEEVPVKEDDTEEKRRKLLPEPIAQTDETEFQLADVWKSAAEDETQENRNAMASRMAPSLRSAAEDETQENRNAMASRMAPSLRSAAYITMEQFIAQMTDDDLSCIIRGEGMGSSLVTPGTASAFGGVSDSLIHRLGIPSVCCSDGPSGMRLDCGVKAFSLPNGTLIGCTFNTELVEELYACTGLEMIVQKVECLLGPGMNIHRHPLNGRNFEYFSEDPYVTGQFAMAMLKGLQSSGVTGAAKHFCANNQEKKRHFADSVVSERALREIYLKGFEMIVRSGVADAIMTTYGPVNGVWTAGNYDLCTTILRNQWGFQGIVMTDWWASINERGGEPDKINFAAMARAQNDIYMVCPDGSTNASGDNTLEALACGRLSRAELQRNAANICRFVMNTEAMKRMLGIETKVTVINRPEEDTDIDLSDVQFVKVDGEITIPLDDKPSNAGTNYVLPFDISKPGKYRISLTGSSELSELAQIPCTLFYTNYPVRTFTFHGTGGKEMTITRDFELLKRFSVMRLFVTSNGLKLKEIRFQYIEESDNNEGGF